MSLKSTLMAWVLTTKCLSVVQRETGIYLHPPLIQSARTGAVRKCGCPLKMLSEQWLREGLSSHRRLTHVQLASASGVHRNTIRKYQQLYNIQPRFSVMVNDRLDECIKAFKTERPESGLRYLIGFLQSKGIRVQRERLHLALARIGSVGQALRRHSEIDRRPYVVTHPNKVWHIDGHHKLISWGIMVHGIVDGFCRTVCLHSHLFKVSAHAMFFCSLLRLLGCTQLRIIVLKLFYSCLLMPQKSMAYPQE